MGRKRRREYRVAFDDTGIAVGCLFADPRAVDQGNAETTFGEMQRHRGAYNAGTENHYISTCHAHLHETVSLYMDCRRRERYQAPILTAAGVSPSEIDQRLRGRTHLLRPPWNAYSSSIDLHRIGGAPSCRGVSATSRRGNRRYADPRLSPRRSGGIAPALDAARLDRRRNGLDNARLACRAWHSVSGVQTRSNDARIVFHAGAANVCTGPDVVSGARSVAWSRCRTYPRNT